MLCKFQILCFSCFMLIVSFSAYGQNVNNADKYSDLKIEPLPDKLDFFPVTTQFSPVPSGKGWKGEEGPLSEEMLRK